MYTISNATFTMRWDNNRTHAKRIFKKWLGTTFTGEILYAEVVQVCSLMKYDFVCHNGKDDRTPCDIESIFQNIIIQIGLKDCNEIKNPFYRSIVFLIEKIFDLQKCYVLQ